MGWAHRNDREASAASAALRGAWDVRFIALHACLAWLLSCAPAPDRLYVPDDMPEICRDIDFRLDASLRAVCGVEMRNYMGYKNIPRHRSLLQPKGGRIVEKGGHLELRLENTLPVRLPRRFEGRIRFGEDMRRTYVHSKMDYCEFFPGDSKRRVRVIRLDIAVERGQEMSVCYTVIPRPDTPQRKTGYASSLSPLECSDFKRLKEAERRKLVPENGEAE